jgi:hypothetical protein
MELVEIEPVVLKKKMSPCSNEKVYLCVHKRENYRSLSKCRGFGVYSMNKTEGRRKMFLTRTKPAS